MQNQINCWDKTPAEVLNIVKYDHTAPAVIFEFGEKSVYPLWLVPFLRAEELGKTITIRAKEVCEYVRKIGENQGWDIIDGDC